MIPCQRSHFDIPSDVAYLNCAYMSPLMNAVVRAGKKMASIGGQAHLDNTEDDFDRLFDALETCL